MPSPDELTGQLLARTRDIPVERTDELIATALTTIADLGVADYVSILERAPDHRLSTRAATHTIAAAADRLQQMTGEGPCLEAAYESHLLVSEDVGGDSRWPAWGPAAVGAGVSAAISVQLYNHNNTMGALNLFHREPRSFTSEDLAVARALAVPLSIYLANGRNQEQLRAAIATRTEIGQAQGVLMHQFGIDEAAAFSVLRRLSQDNNIKLNQVAAQIVTAQTLPSRYGGSPAED